MLLISAKLFMMLAIVGTFLGLLLPAVNSAREAGRRPQRARNLRQIALSLVNYETGNGFFCPAAWAVTAVAPFAQPPRELSGRASTDCWPFCRNSMNRRFEIAS